MVICVYRTFRFFNEYMAIITESMTSYLNPTIFNIWLPSSLATKIIPGYLYCLCVVINNSEARIKIGIHTCVNIFLVVFKYVFSVP